MTVIKQIGFNNHSNFGDDLILDAMKQSLPYDIICDNPIKNERVLIGGGQLIAEPFWDKFDILGRWFGYALGIGPLYKYNQHKAGPIENGDVHYNPNVHEKIVKTLKNFERITVRDTMSYNTLKNMGIDSVLTGDPVINMKMNEVHVNTPDGLKIGVCIRNDFEQCYHINMKEYIKFLLGFDGLPEIYYFPFSVKDDFPQAKFISNNTKCTVFMPTPMIANLLKHMDVIISSRLHMLILGANFGIPIIPIINHIKIEAFANDMGIEGVSQNINIKDHINNLNLKKLKQKVINGRDKLQERELGNKRELKKWMDD